MKKITLLLTLFSFVFSFAQSTPPGGTTCAAASTNGDLGTAASVSLTGTTIVTDSQGGSQEVSPGVNRDAAWFQWTAPGNGSLNVNSCGGGSDTRLYIHSDCVPTQVAFSDDACATGTGSSFASEVDGFVVTNGTTYLIEWDDRWSEGPFDWSLTWEPCVQPSGSTAVVENCAGGTFDINVTVSSLGDASSVTITNDGGAAPVQVTTTGVTNIGPFPIGTPVNVTLVHDQNSQCNVDLGASVDSCPPPNDDCSGAIAVLCGNSYSGNTSGASPGTETICGEVDQDANVMWYSFNDGGTAQTVTLSLCTSSYDTSIAVYTGTCGALVCFANNDDFCGTRSEVEFTSTANTDYYIAVEGWNGSSGAFTMDVSCVPAATPPPNDLCANAETLIAGNPPTNGDNTNATSNVLNPSCDPFGVISDVWYTFTLSGPNNYDVTITTVTGTADLANVAVYTACDQATEVACSDETVGGETLNIPSLAAGTYVVQVWNDGAAAPGAPGTDPNRQEGTFTIALTTTVLSVDQFELNSFDYFPNPVNDKLSLRAQSTIDEISVYNLLGQEVMRMTPDTLNAEVDMNNLSNGAYFVKVSINDVTETIRVVKK